MARKTIPFGPFIRGLDASTGVSTQPKGSIPRGSNLILSKRGALRTCDGSLIVNAFNGVPTAGRGRDMCTFLFVPMAVAAYYLRVMKALDYPLGPPKNLVAAVQAGGTLALGTYYYVVTAVDGAGGETTISNEVSATTTTGNQTVHLTWNQVPNAAGYNVYRGTTPGAEQKLVGSNLPATGLFYNDNGVASIGTAVAVASATCYYRNNFASPAYAKVTIVLTTPIANQFQVQQGITMAASSNASFNVVYTVNAINSNYSLDVTWSGVGGGPAQNTSTTGGTVTPIVNPPGVDSTQQTGLYAMPPAALGVPYSNANLVALWPADPGAIDGAGGGGGGGGGGGTGGGGGGQGQTPSGGVVGNLALIPQIVQFTNQAVIALGNGFPVQVYSDPNGTTTNPASKISISSIAVDAFGVVTVTTSGAHGISATQGIGTNVIISAVTNSLYNMVGPIMSIPSGTTFTVRNLAAIGQAASSGGLVTVSTQPLMSLFVPAYPQWAASIAVSINTIIVPTVSNGHYYKAVQGGTTGAAQPTFPTGTGARVADGSVIWQESGLLNTAAPPPPSGAHIVVYAGSLWVFNTWATNTSTGLDGPTSLRMSDVNNLQSWNPINQAFLDKDDGQEGLGLGNFTIAAQGIPPEGSLCAFKKKNLYQIVGVFGSSNFAIQRAQTDMGTVAPRTIQFIPGYGLGRITHLGVAVFDGVNDRLISPQVQPYLIGSNDPDVQDIVPMDLNWQSVSQAALVANPAMYCIAIPVGVPGTSNGALTRLLCFDLVLKGWAVIDLPFPISTLTYVTTVSTIVITLMGSYSDGTLQRWQAGDLTWATASSGSQTSAAVQWSMRSPTVSSKDAYQNLLGRRVVVVGQMTGGSLSTVKIQPRVDGQARVAVPALVKTSAPSSDQGVVGAGGVALATTGTEIDFSSEGPISEVGRRFDAIISGQGRITIDAIAFDIEPRPLGVPAGSVV